MPALDGRTVAVLESRQSEELALLVRRLGGMPLSVPAMREIHDPGDSLPVLRRMLDGEVGMIVVLTGAGITALLGEAARHGCLDALRERLARMTIVCRGPKPLAALKRAGLSAQIMTAKPHTTRELIDALADVPLGGVSVALLHYGEENTRFSAALAERGAMVDDVCLYRWALPEDIAPLQDLVRAAIAGSIDVLIVTSQIQFRHLQQVATSMGEAGRLADALNDHVVVGAVGPVCAAALRAGGVTPDVLPASPNSVSLLNAVGDYFELMARERNDV
jgi:uroporphyrinogen-III synthase